MWGVLIGAPWGGSDVEGSDWTYVGSYDWNCKAVLWALQPWRRRKGRWKILGNVNAAGDAETPTPTGRRAGAGLPGDQEQSFTLRPVSCEGEEDIGFLVGERDGCGVTVPSGKQWTWRFREEETRSEPRHAYMGTLSETCHCMTRAS